MKLARFTLACAFCQSFRRAQAPEQREVVPKVGTLEQKQTSSNSNDHSRSGSQNCQNSAKNRAKILEKPSQIDEKSSKNRSWLVLGVQRRSGIASGRVRDAPGTRQSWSKSDLGSPRTRQERPGDDQERPRDGPKTLRRLSGATSACVRRKKYRRTRHRNDFSSFLS